MLIQYIRGGDFLDAAFYNPMVEDFDLQVLSLSSTQIVAVNPGTGVVTTFTGTGFPASPVPPLSGTLTGMAIVDSQNRPMATLTGFSWGLQSTLTALEQAVGNDATTLLLGLLSLQPITLDASAAVEPIGDLSFEGVTSDIGIIGSGFADVAIGGSGSDTIEGGDGIDRVRYDRDARFAGGTGGVTVNLALQTAIDGFGNTDTLISIEQVIGSDANDVITGSSVANMLNGKLGNDRLVGDGGNDTLLGGDGTDTLNGGDGDDFLFGGDSAADLRDVVYGGAGHDSIDGGYGNDELNGGTGNDTIQGGFGADTMVGNENDDQLIGGAGSDLMSGNAGNDTLNGGFGHDRLNGGTGADVFFHLGIADHGSDWVQDYSAAEGDVLQLGIAGATRSQLQVNYTNTAGAGSAGVAEAFVIYRPTGQILWALVDGAGQEHINVRIGGQVYDLMA